MPTWIPTGPPTFHLENGRLPVTDSVWIYEVHVAVSCAVADALDLPTHPHGSALWKNARATAATSTRSYKAEINKRVIALVDQGWLGHPVHQTATLPISCMPAAETVRDSRRRRVGRVVAARAKKCSGRGRSGLRRAGCWLTASRSDPQESATENRPPMARLDRAQARVKRCGKAHRRPR